MGNYLLLSVCPIASLGNVNSKHLAIKHTCYADRMFILSLTFLGISRGVNGGDPQIRSATLAPYTHPLPGKPEESKNQCHDNRTCKEIMATGSSCYQVKQDVTRNESSGIGKGSHGTEGGLSSDGGSYMSPTTSLQSGHSQKEARSSLLPWQCTQTANDCWQGTDLGNDG